MKKHKGYVEFSGGCCSYADGRPMLMHQVPCHHCGKTIFDFSLIAYCEDCRKIKLTNMVKELERLKSNESK